MATVLENQKKREEEASVVLVSITSIVMVNMSYNEMLNVMRPFTRLSQRVPIACVEESMFTLPRFATHPFDC